MSQKSILRAKGLYTHPNLLSELPEGALVEANNVIIDRDSVIEPRRGFAQYGSEFGIGSDRAKQLIDYKDRVLVHYNNRLLYNANPHNNSVDGDFQQFSGTYLETETGLRIKYVESNKNLYFTTNDGIKKIAAKTAADFTTSAGFIVDAGGIKALDLNGSLSPALSGFLPPNSKVAYRLTWSRKDINDNLIEGVPSSRLVITNFSDNNANVNLQFPIPQAIDENYFYRLYRTPVITATGSLTLDDIDPGDEMNLVVEDYPTSAELLAKSVTLEDIAPETFRVNGLLLYTNPTSGEGIGQSNEPPPQAKDVDMYQNTVFYANTKTRAQTTISLLGLSGLVSNTSSITVTDGVTPRTYTFQGRKEITNINFSAYTGTIPTQLDGKYFLINSSSDVRKYYVWYDTTLTTQRLDFSTYIGAIPVDLDGKYAIIYTENERKYYIWFDATGTTADPGSDPNNTELINLLSIKVPINIGVTTKAQVAAAVNTALTTNNIFNDFILLYTPGNDYLEVQTSAFDQTTAIIENIQKGFVFTITTPINNDPANDLITNTDVVGRAGLRVDISKGVTTKAQLADATAASAEENDNALDFDITYNPGDEFFVVETTNNGATTDATDSAINPIGNGFTITVTQQGLGEDLSLNKVLLSNAPTPSLQIDESARSLVKVINADLTGSVYAYYISGPNDLPGQILLEVRDIGTSSFTITANDAVTGEKFNPSLPPVPGAAPVQGLSETKPNRIYFAKVQQPEAVPLLNFLDVGPEDKEIFRILALRESLFILKQDGVYRLTGFSGSFTVDAFDKSTQIISPDTAVVLNNQIYCLTNQGVAVISDTGISIISRPIENVIDLLTSSNYNFKFTSFGVSYETDRAYLLFMVSNTPDTVATQCLRYNTFTQTWTRWDISKTCGLVNPADDKLYLGPADENFIERERKLFKRTDYADRQFEISIIQNGVNENNVSLSTSQIQQVGDALVQEQKLTINEFNQLLKKIDLDPFVGSPEQFTVDFTSYIGSLPASLDGKYFLINTASDAQMFYVMLDATGNTDLPDPITSSDIIGRSPIVVNIVGLTTLAQITDQVQNTIKSVTQQFIINYINGAALFTARTVKSGQTTDSQDSIINGLSNGFIINTTLQGFGDYFETLQALPGVNFRSKLNDLAIKLDADPSVNDTNYLASLTGGTTFTAFQTDFNIIVNKLNLDTGVFFTNYLLSNGTKVYESLIESVIQNQAQVVVEYGLEYIEGPVTLYKGINAKIIYGPETFGDPSVLKQVREGTVMFENNTFTKAEVGYATDLSPGYIFIAFNENGKGDWGSFIWGEQNWGGGFSGIPKRTYIPQGKQRCRYIQCQYRHSSAREKWAIFGISYTVNQTSERGYRG